MDKAEVEYMMEKMVISGRKMDETIVAVEKDVHKLTEKRNLLKEEVQKLKEQVSRLDKDVSISRQLILSSEQSNQRKLQENMVLAVEIGKSDWDYKWHNIIAENQREELEENIKRMNKLSGCKGNLKNSSKVVADKASLEYDSEITHLKDENEKIEQEIKELRNNLPTNEDVARTKKEIVKLQERNGNILSRLRGQIGYMESHNKQASAYLESLKQK